MSSLSWPIGNKFPQDIMLDDTFVPSDDSISEEMEVGPAYRRLRDTVNYGIWTGSLMLSNTHRAMLLQFWQTDTRNGSIPFVWHDPVTKEEKTYRLTAAPTFSSQGAGWHTATITFEEVP